MSSRHRRLAAALAALSAVAFSSLPQATTSGTGAEDSRWHFNVVPYLWLPVVEGSIDTDVVLPGRLGGKPRQVKVSGDIDPSSYLSDLDRAFMIMGEARKDRRR